MVVLSAEINRQKKKKRPKDCQFIPHSLVFICVHFNIVSNLVNNIDNLSLEKSRLIMSQRIQDVCCKVRYKHLGVICVLVFGQHCAQCLGIIHVFRNFDFFSLVSARHEEKHQTFVESP